MTMTIWKIPVWASGIRPHDGEVEINARMERVLHSGLDSENNLCSWVLVEPSDNTITVLKITVLSTGNTVPNDMAAEWTYAGTVIDGKMVWHVFIDWYERGA